MKVLITVPDDVMTKVDTWLVANSSTSRSHFFRLLARAYFGNTSKLSNQSETLSGVDYKKSCTVSDKEYALSSEPECEVRFCKSKASGKYKIVTSSSVFEQNLCKFHLNIVKREAQVSQLN